MKNKKNGTILFDLDGTVLDVSERIYRLYKEILKGNKKKFLSKKEYIRLKQEKTDNLAILKKTGAQDILKIFTEEWHKKIESRDFLSFDKVAPKTLKTLNLLKKNYELVLVTLRDDPNNLKKELRGKNLDKIFSKVLTKSGKGIKDKYLIKHRLIKEYSKKNNVCIVGDTETDILAGKKAGIKTVGMGGGMRSLNFLKKYKPDFLAKNILNLNAIFRLKKTI